MDNMHKHLHSTFLLVWCKWCPGRDLNPHSPCGEKDFKSFASASFATRARLLSTTYTIYSQSHRQLWGICGDSLPIHRGQALES